MGWLAGLLLVLVASGSRMLVLMVLMVFFLAGLSSRPGLSCLLPLQRRRLGLAFALAGLSFELWKLPL